MIYPGDLVPIVVSLQTPDGLPAQVEATPVLSIVRVETGQPALPAPVLMEPSPFSPEVFVYIWNTAGAEEGWYQAYATWAAGGKVYQNRYLGQWKLGDSRIRGLVAREAVVAKEATAARADGVLTPEQFAAAFALPAGQSGTPGQLLSQIWSKVERLPYDPAPSSLVQELAAVLGRLEAHAFGRWELNRATGELALYSSSQPQPVARFQLVQQGDLTIKEPV